MNKYINQICIVLVLILTGCQEDFQPKPKGYHRISKLEKNIINLDINCPFTFQYPDYLEVELGKKDPCSINLHSNYYNSTLHMTYKAIDNDLELLLGDFARLPYEHASKADGIDDILGIDTENKVYSLFFELHGPVASSLQFLATDSTNHIIRGSLYFNTVPNVDSLRPVHNTHKEDMLKIIESLRWQ